VLKVTIQVPYAPDLDLVDVPAWSARRSDAALSTGGAAENANLPR